MSIAENYEFAVCIIILGDFSVLNDFYSDFSVSMKLLIWPVFRFLIGPSAPPPPPPLPPHETYDVG